jgi:hypothetical protein
MPGRKLFLHTASVPNRQPWTITTTITKIIKAVRKAKKDSLDEDGPTNAPTHKNSVPIHAPDSDTIK